MCRTAAQSANSAIVFSRNPTAFGGPELLRAKPIRSPDNPSFDVGTFFTNETEVALPPALPDESVF